MNQSNLFQTNLYIIRRPRNAIFLFSEELIIIPRQFVSSGDVVIAKWKSSRLLTIQKILLGIAAPRKLFSLNMSKRLIF